MNFRVSFIALSLTKDGLTFKFTAHGKLVKVTLDVSSQGQTLMALERTYYCNAKEAQAVWAHLVGQGYAVVTPHLLDTMEIGPA